MNLELYKTFYFVARYENISKASEQLYITQPAVSRAIRQLEDALGCSLFFRTPRGVKLTQEGVILYNYIDKAFNFISNAEKELKDVKNLLQGEIKIGVSDTLCKYYLIPHLKLFNTLHPAINIHVTCPTTPGIISLLKAGMIDFGIINMPYKDDRLLFKDIMEVQDTFVAGDKYRHLANKVQPLCEIVKNPMLLLEKSSNSRSYINRYFQDNNVTINPAFELGNIDLLTQFAKYNFGIACVIRNFISDELDKGRLFEIIPIEKIPSRFVGVAWLADVPLSKASRELISLLDTGEDYEL